MKTLLISTDCASNTYRKLNNSYGGVTYYRLVAPQKAINAQGHDWQYFGNDLYKDGRDNFNKFFKNFDIVITKHIDKPSGAKNVLMGCHKNGIPLVYDLDDDLFAIREDQPAYENGYRQGHLKRVYLATNMSFADAFFVSTEPLKESYQKMYKDMFNVDMPIFVLPNYNDVELFNFASPKNVSRVVIGYHGSVTHDSDLKMLLPVVDKLMYKHKNFYMQIMGSVRKESLDELFKGIYNVNRFEITPGTPAFDHFPERLMSNAWDIGVAPLIDDQFNRGKSHIKYLEYSMKRIPTVASDVFPYRENAKHAILCKTPQDWYNRLDTLILNKKKRDRIGEESYEHVVKECQYKDHAHKWIDAAQTVIKNHSKNRKRL